MNSDVKFDVTTAQRYKDEGRLEEWINTYLTSGEWANPALAQGLKQQQRWWAGPLELTLNALTRCCGPEPNLEYHVSLDTWQKRTKHLADGLTTLSELPPLIIEYQQGLLSIRDGNHRHEAMRLKGWLTCWVIIWYNAEKDFLEHQKKIGMLTQGD